MARDIFARDFKQEPFWWEAARPFCSMTELPEIAELGIVGGGLCGLSAARRALELGIQPTVIDAGAIAGGASSRSGAMLSSGQKFLINGTAQRLSPDLLGELTSAHTEAFSYVRGLANSADMEHCFQPSGRLFLAAVPKDLTRFAGHARILSDIAGMTARVIGRAELGAEIGSSHYHGGLLVEEFGGLDPARLCVALARDAERRGAILRSHTRVISVRREGGSFLLKTEAGDLRARQVLFATNGYSDAALPVAGSRLAPVDSCMIATSELARETMLALMPTQRMYSDTKRNLWYFRPSPDGKRILFGARPGLLSQSPTDAAHLLHGFLTQVFPALSDVEISHAWKGVVAMTRSHLQHIGQHEGCWFALGCNGSGVAIMPWLGRLAIERMFGERSTPTVFERMPFGRLPNLAGIPWYVPVAAGSFGLADWLDRRRAGL